MNKVRLAVTLLPLLVIECLAVGTADTAIQAEVDNVVATWGGVKTAMLGIGVFLIGYAFFKRIRRA